MGGRQLLIFPWLGPAGSTRACGLAMSSESRALAALRSTTGYALIAATVFASAVAAINASVIRVAVPAIGRDLNADVVSLQWTVTSYLVTTAGLLLLAGALADQFGRKRILIIGLLIMLASSVLCTVAPTVESLIAARLVQGVGGALVTPTALALLSGTLRVDDRARGIGIWVGLETLVASFGPYVGGWLVDQVSWRAVFLLNVPLVLLSLLALGRVPESSDARKTLSLDGLGSVLGVVGLAALIYALTAGPSSGWLSAPVLITGVIGVVALAALVPVERRVPDPILKLSLFASRQFDAINMTTLLLYGALGAAGYMLVLQLQLQLGYTAAQAGAAVIPTTAMFLLISPISGALVSRFGPRWLMVSGILCVSASMAWLSAAHAGATYLETILPPVVLWGIGIGVAVTPLTAAVLAAVDDADLGEASGINDAAARVGSVVAIALVPALIGAGAASTLGDALTHGYQPAMLVMAALAAGSAVIAAVFVTDQRAAKHEDQPTSAVSEPAAT
jgi:EmrB/QacA subfamily drug resistance transporter